ncbi:MAG TPA: hypothetical protein DDZ51_25340, partial [Planctomycetaceae bacterium]|nr:hypothetical protein [Planctomycetaceae bacterium]
MFFKSGLPVRILNKPGQEAVLPQTARLRTLTAQEPSSNHHHLRTSDEPRSVQQLRHTKLPTPAA